MSQNKSGLVAIVALAIAHQAIAEITPGDYKSFVIDFDKPAKERYQELFTYFKPQLADMEDYWWNEFYGDELRQWFRDNIDGLFASQPDAYEFSEALADFLGLEVAQTFGVSAITEVSTYCTSIIARNLDGEIAHVRNLDFKYTDVMKELVYDAQLYFGGEYRASAPSIAGFYGAFTGQKPGVFSISFDVREREAGATHEIILGNLERNLDSARGTQASVIQNALLTAETYDYAVELLSEVPMTSVGHYIIGGVKGNEGIVISRDEDNTVHRYELTDDQWYVAITNVDVWEFTDARYENAIKFLKELGQENIKPDGQSIIEQVLWQDGVIQDDSIFTAAISAHPGTKVAIYDSPSYYQSHYNPL